MLRNAHKDKSLQIDYYRRVREWTCALYRWGVRMTWDRVLPDPGRDLRRKVQELVEVEGKLAAPFNFDVGISAVSEATWESLAAQYGATLAPPPAPRRDREVAGFHAHGRAGNRRDDKSGQLTPAVRFSGP